MPRGGSMPDGSRRHDPVPLHCATDRAVFRSAPHASARRQPAHSRILPRHVSTAATLCSAQARSEEHTSELQSLMSNSYAVFSLKKQHTITSSAYNNTKNK